MYKCNHEVQIHVAHGSASIHMNIYSHIYLYTNIIVHIYAFIYLYGIYKVSCEKINIYVFYRFSKKDGTSETILFLTNFLFFPSTQRLFLFLISFQNLPEHPGSTLLVPFQYVQLGCLVQLQISIAILLHYTVFLLKSFEF